MNFNIPENLLLSKQNKKKQNKTKQKTNKKQTKKGHFSDDYILKESNVAFFTLSSIKSFPVETDTGTSQAQISTELVISTGLLLIHLLGKCKGALKK